MAEAKPKKSKKSAPAAEKKPALPAKKVRRPPVPRGAHGGIQLLLVDDVEHLGRAGDVVEVRPGYARNFLLPRGHATYVTPHNLRLLEMHKIKVDKMREAKLADLRALSDQLQRVTVTVEANANAEGHLYGSIGPLEISRALKAMNLFVEPDHVRMEGPIRELALYAVKVHLAAEIESEVKVLVIGATAKA
ncbi:MAG TPA: 50S ribosomal protein L9 [Gemmatales bacterium]|nr:50S ribosomal protein L9 [Gemmatales bacterium]HMP57942.1 50S ribosomal protein L9 [Gemmatales bacterium]